MKILHTADWHLGKRLQDFNRIEEQRQVLEEIIRIADKESVDVVLVAGDLFDTFNPVTEAIELFYSTLYRLSDNGKRAVVAIAGNHDSAERIEAPHPLAANCGIILYGNPDTIVRPFVLNSGLGVLQAEPGFLELQIPGFEYPLRLLLTPYANEYTYRKFLGKERPKDQLRALLSQRWKALAKKYCNNKGINLLVAHLYFMDKHGIAPEESDDEKSILFQGGAQAIFTEDIPDKIQYTALGHLHRPQEIPATHPVVYSGSPLSYSFSEADQKKQVEIVEIEPGQIARRKSVQLKRGQKLTRQRFEDFHGAISWLEDHQNSYVELTMVVEDFLSAAQKKELHTTHQKIVSIIPEITQSPNLNEIKASIDLSKDLKSLFIDYYKYKKDQSPSPDLLAVLDEIIND